MKLLVLTAASLCLFGQTHAQFYVKNTFMQTYHVSNTGEVVGYTDWGGPYMIWTPETSTTDTINGLAPGNGIGGRAMFSLDGNYLSGTMQGPDGPEMARYNRGTDTWTPLGSLGYSLDGTWSAGYAISGDGNTVAGNSWADTTGGYGYMHGIAWNTTEGIMDLGTLFFGRSTRVNAVSGNGAVLAGWQDFNGPWKSAVWRKNPAGGYFPNEYILLNPAGNPDDEYNQMGECTAISGDGMWIGGAGDYANSENPWIWSEASGVIDLGTLHEDGRGYVAGLNEDGSVAVGRIQIGPWDPELAFIWTAADGIQDLNDYATARGLNLGNNLLYSANSMSPDGRYIAGYGVDTVTQEFIAYRMSLFTLGTNAFTTTPIQLYPNPSSDKIVITISGPGSNITICDPEGKIVYRTIANGTTVVDISHLSSGMYFVTTEENGRHRSMHFLKQ